MEAVLGLEAPSAFLGGILAGGVGWVGWGRREKVVVVDAVGSTGSRMDACWKSVAVVVVREAVGRVKKRRDRREGKEAREGGRGRDKRLCLYTEKWGAREDAQSVNCIPGRCTLLFSSSSLLLLLLH